MIEFADQEFMEVELPLCDPNLNVTSAPEHFDLFPEFLLPGDASFLQDSEDRNPELTELTKVDPTADASFIYDLAECTDASDTLQTGVSPGLQQPPLTVTLVRPTAKQLTLVAPSTDEDTALLHELYIEDDAPADSSRLARDSQKPCVVSSNAQLRLCKPSLPLHEPQGVEFDLVSSTDSLDTGSTYTLEEAPESQSATSVQADRQTDIERKASYIREIIEKRNNKPDDMSSKLKVHEVILVILLNSVYGDRSKDLQRILTFCDENGKETSRPEDRHFKTLDTETMGLLWQRIKGNKKGNYDTFARAMRVRRERSEGFFDYLEVGKGKKKRIYRFGDRSMEEMARFKRTLRQVSKPQTGNY